MVLNSVDSWNDSFNHLNRCVLLDSQNLAPYIFDEQSVFSLILGGLAAVLYTDLVQTVVMLFGAILLTGIGELATFPF